MIFTAQVIPKDKWCAEDTHLVVFGEHRPESLNSFQFVLGAIDSEGMVAGYSTCIEMDKETLYLQHGGILPSYAKSIHVFNAYGKCILWCREHYKRVTTKIENKNIRMLKLALQMGFLIVGTSTFKNKVYLDLILEF